jgi:hypothetical protein
MVYRWYMNGVWIVYEACMKTRSGNFAVNASITFPLKENEKEQEKIVEKLIQKYIPLHNAFYDAAKA